MALDKDQLHALLADYVEGSLSESQIEEAEAYLEANPGVRAVIDQLMVDSEALRALPPVRSPVDYSEPITVTAERNLLLDDALPTGRAPRFGTPALATAAMLLLGLGLAGSAWWLLTSRPASFDYAKVMPAMQAAATAPAEPTSAAAQERAPNLSSNSRDEQQQAPMLDQLRDAPAANGPAAPEAMAASPPPAEVIAADGRADEAASPAPARAPAPIVGASPGAAGSGGGGFGGGRMAKSSAPETPRAESSGPAEAIAQAQARAMAKPGAVPNADPALDAVPANDGEATKDQRSKDDATARSARAILDSLPRPRPALVVVVRDVAQLDAIRDRVREAVPPLRRADVVYQNVQSQAVVAAPLPADVGPLVATEVSADALAAVRRAVDGEADVAIVELPASADETRRQQQPSQQQLNRDLLSNQIPTSLPAAGDAHRPAPSDVYVLLVPADAPAAATQPAAR